MREIRYLDKLIDEIARGKAMDKILRRQKDNAGFAIKKVFDGNATIIAVPLKLFVKNPLLFAQD